MDFAEIQGAPPRSPLGKWRTSIEAQQDLWLRSGVKCLVSLRQAMIVDELTLMALGSVETSAILDKDSLVHIAAAWAGAAIGNHRVGSHRRPCH
jgi:hypothetical protein